MARSPTLSQLATQVAALTKKLAAIEATTESERAASTARTARADAKPARPAKPTAASPASAASVATLPADDLLALVERRQAAPKKRGARGGAVVYGGAVSAGGGEFLWAIERPAANLLDLDPTRIAAVLALLGSAPRVRILLALVDAPRTAADLQRLLASKSPGPVYHHLKDLLAMGVVTQVDRRYVVPARHVVPILTACALAIDLGARAP